MERLECCSREAENLAFIIHLAIFNDYRLDILISRERKNVAWLNAQRIQFQPRTASLRFIQSLLLFLFDLSSARINLFEFADAYREDDLFRIYLEKLALRVDINPANG